MVEKNVHNSSISPMFPVKRDAAHGGQVPFRASHTRHRPPVPTPPPPPTPTPRRRPLTEKCSLSAQPGGNRVLWQPHPRHGLSQPVKNVAVLVKGQLNPPNFGCTWVVSQWTSMLGKAARPWWRCVCVCAGAGLCLLHVCVHACTRSVCARVACACTGGVGALCACAHLRFAWTRVRGPGQLHRSSASDAGTGPSGTASSQAKSAPAEAKGPNPGCKPRSATAALRLPWGH